MEFEITGGLQVISALIKGQHVWVELVSTNSESFLWAKTKLDGMTITIMKDPVAINPDFNGTLGCALDLLERIAATEKDPTLLSTCGYCKTLVADDEWDTEYDGYPRCPVCQGC